MWHWKLLAVVLALGIPAEQVNPQSMGRKGARSSPRWNRRAFDMLHGKVVCQRQADPALIRDLLRKRETSIETYCSISGLVGKKGDSSKVSWKEVIELEFQTSAGKEALKEVKLYGTFLVFFLDEEKDWLPSQERNFSITIKKGRWSKHELVCVADDSKYIILELPAKACEWFCSPSLHISMQMRPLTADTEKNWTAASQQDCARVPGAAECQESLPQKLLFAWDIKRYTRIPPTILAVLKHRRSTRKKDH